VYGRNIYDELCVVFEISQRTAALWTSRQGRVVRLVHLLWLRLSTVCKDTLPSFPPWTFRLGDMGPAREGNCLALACPFQGGHIGLQLLHAVVQRLVDGAFFRQFRFQRSDPIIPPIWRRVRRSRRCVVHQFRVYAHHRAVSIVIPPVSLGSFGP
jgi:hypothetical protein